MYVRVATFSTCFHPDCNPHLYTTWVHGNRLYAFTILSNYSYCIRCWYNCQTELLNDYYLSSDQIAVTTNGATSQFRKTSNYKQLLRLIRARIYNNNKLRGKQNLQKVTRLETLGNKITNDSSFS